MGVLYSNWAYDYFTLWKRPALPEDFAKSLAHYQKWGTLPSFLYYVHHFIAFLGLIGFILKLYKPSESNKLFDGASLFIYMVGIVIYLSNLRIGVMSAVHGEWGDVDENTGINVIAASQVLIVFTFLGVLGLQVGQYWAEVEDQKVLKRAMEEEEKELAAAAEATKSSKSSKSDSSKKGSTTSSEASSTTANKKKK